MVNDERPGTFIVFAGIDGAGKTTTAAALARLLRERDPARDVIDVNVRRPQIAHSYAAQHLGRMERLIWPRDPSEPQIGLGHLHYIFLLGAWFDAVDRHCVRPALAAGKTVVCDTWTHKIVARSHLRGEDIDEEHRIAFEQRLSKPDLVVFLDVDPERAARRKERFTSAEAGNDDGLEGLTPENFVVFQSRVRDELLRMSRSQPERWLVLPVADEGPEAVAQQALTTSEFGAIFRAAALHGS